MVREDTNELYSFTPSPDNFIDKLIVHGGIFHADDALCAVVAKSINPSVKIESVFKVPDHSQHAQDDPALLPRRICV